MDGRAAKINKSELFKPLIISSNSVYPVGIPLNIFPCLALSVIATIFSRNPPINVGVIDEPRLSCLKSNIFFSTSFAMESAVWFFVPSLIVDARFIRFLLI